MKKKLSFKKGTRAARKRSEVAEAIAREHPAYSMMKKFRMATSATKKMMLRGLRGR